MQPVVPTPSIAIPSFSMFSGAVNAQSVLAVIFTLIFIWWAVYTLVAAYHWFRFGRESWVAVPAMVLHLLVSAWIFVFATGGLH